MKNRCISVIGLGKLGLPLAAAFASRSFNVIGVDINPEVVDLVNRKIPPIFEPHLREMLSDVVGVKLRATTEMSEITKTDVTIILVPTPTQEDDTFTSKYALDVCRALGEVLKTKDGYHLVVVSSTVMPGSCSGEIRSELEVASGCVVGETLGLCYCPEFAALGNVINGFLYPDLVMIGSSDPYAYSKLERVYQKFVMNDAPIFTTSLINAELAKMCLNFYVTMKIAFANQLATMCESILGANVDEITGIIGHDSRIGTKYLRGALPAGGSCFPRDIRAITALCGQYNVPATLPLTIRTLNRDALRQLYLKVLKAILDQKADATVGILGIAFKPDTDVMDESTGVFLTKKFDQVVAYDPLAVVGQSVRTAQECVDQSDIVVVTTMCPEFLNLVYRSGQIVIDCWRFLNKEKVERQGASYQAIGIG